MGNHVQARGVNVPSVGPGPQTQGYFFPHETPGCVGIKGHGGQKVGVRKEESRGNERNLRRAILARWSVPVHVDAKNVVFHGVLGKGGRAQSGPGGTAHVLAVVLLKAGWVGRQDGFWVILGSPGLVDVVLIPVGGKLQVGIHLHKEGFSRPKLAGVESCRLGAESVRIVYVQDPDLSVVAILFVFFVGAEFFDAVLVWRFGTDGGSVVSVFVLSDDDQTRFADCSVEAKAILDHGSKE
mmetsp:Transcript_15911/g.34507  ORF Transcript_15911/g.34507 Transcript_15911/m.34507 type:complete len:239 (+) Transcript_15911:1403-2119(+)